MRKLAAILTTLALVLPATAAAKSHVSRRHESSPVQVRHHVKARCTRSERGNLAPLPNPKQQKAACAGWGYTLT